MILKLGSKYIDPATIRRIVPTEDGNDLIVNYSVGKHGVGLFCFPIDSEEAKAAIAWADKEAATPTGDAANRELAEVVARQSEALWQAAIALNYVQQTMKTWQALPGGQSPWAVIEEALTAIENAKNGGGE